MAKWLDYKTYVQRSNKLIILKFVQHQNALNQSRRRHNAFKKIEASGKYWTENLCLDFPVEKAAKSGLSRSTKRICDPSHPFAEAVVRVWVT